MERIHFIRKASGLIMVRVNYKHFKGGRFTFSTGQQVTATNWKDGAIKKDQPTRWIATYPRVRDYFQAIRNTIEKHLTGRGNEKILRRELESLGKTAPRTEGFFDQWKAIIESTVTGNGQPIKSGTRRSKLQTLTKVMEYNPDLCAEDVTINFYYEFSKWLDETIPRTKGKHLKELKAILAQMDDRGYPVPQDFRKKSFRVPRLKADTIYLTMDEIDKIYHTKVAPNLQPIRDMFVIASLTGQRIGDWKQLTPDNVEDELLKVTQEKTGQTVYIPIHNLVRIIWNKYKGLPPMLSEQKFNANIKKVAEKAKLGMTKIDGEAVEKHLHVSSHTARRSFASNAFLEGMDTLSIRQFTGHKSESAFLSYIRLSQKEHGMKTKAHSFFTAKMKIA